MTDQSPDHCGVIMNTENLYIRLYEDITPTAEYLQADSEHRNFLPEAMVVAGLGVVLSAFCKGLFDTLGKAVGETVLTRIKAAFKTSEETGDRAAMLEGLELLRPFLEHLSKLTPEQRDALRDVVAAALAKRGYPDDVAKRTCAELIASLTAAGGEPAR